MAINEPNPPRPSAAQRLVAPLGFALAALLFVFGTFLVFRTQIVDYLIADAMRDAGLRDVSLTVSKVGIDGLTVRDLTAENGALRIAQIDAGFTAFGMLRSRIDSLTVEKGEATLTWDGDGLKLGNFRPAPDSPPLDLPYIGRLRGDMNIVVNAPAAVLRAPLTISADAVDNGWNATATGTVQGPGVNVVLDWAGVIAPSDLSQSTGRGRFDLTVDDFLIPGTAKRVDARGLVTLDAANGEFAIRVVQPLTFSTSAPAETAQARLLQSLANLPWTVTIAPSQSEAALVLSAAGDRRAARVDIAATGQSGNGHVNLAFVGEAAGSPQTTEFKLSKAHADLRSLPFAGGAVSGHVTVSNFNGTTSAAKGRIDAAFDVAGVMLADVALEDARASLASAVSITDGTVKLDLDTLRLNLTRGVLGTWVVAAPAELSLAKTAKNTQSLSIGPFGLSNSADLALALPELALRQRGDEQSQIVVRAPDLRIAASSKLLTVSTSIAATNLSVSHPAAEMQSGRLELKLGDGDASGTASGRFVRLGPAADGAAPRGALVTHATLTTDDGDYDIRGTLASASGQKLGDYAARIGMDVARGTASLSIPKTKFERGGKIDASELGFVAPVSDLSGTLGLQAKSSWTGGRKTDQATATLEDVSFAIGDVSVAGLTTTLDLTALSPPWAEKQQRLVAQSITAGLPLSGLTADFTLPGDGTVTVSQGAVAVAGGQLTLASAVLPIDGQPGTFSLGVQKIDMAQLAAQAKVDGLSVSGTLSGTLPLRSDETGYHFVEGVLRADGPGRLAYKPSSPPEALAQNQGGSLLLQALSNFVYDKLSITLNGPVTEEISLGVALAGKNPDLYGGYPFEFNLNISGRLSQILRQGLVSYGVPADLERQIREGKRP
jgi:hypothetical protein